MKLARKKTAPMKETQMVSLADIAFLLIFFFMLSSQFMKDRTEVALPTLPKLAETTSEIVVSMDAKGKIILNGDAMADQNALESSLRTLLAGKTKPEDCEVRFLCDKGMTYKKYRPVYEAISNAGGVIAVMHDMK